MDGRRDTGGEAGDAVDREPVLRAVSERNERCASMRAGRLPIGEAVQNPRTGTWTYRIDKDRLISYKHGVMPEADIQTLERKLDEFTQMARKLIDTVREERAMMYQ